VLVRADEREGFVTAGFGGEAPCELRHPPARLEHARLCERAAADRAHDGVDGAVCELGGVADEEEIDSGFEPLDHHRFDREVVRNGFHLEIVADHDSGVPEPAAEQAPDDRLAHRGRPGRIQRFEHHVGGHDRRDAGARCGREGNELHLLETLHGVRQARELEVRVAAGVAVSREVLGTGGHARVAETRRERHAERRDPLRLRTERALADHGVVRVRVDVEHRCKVEVDADGPELPPDHATVRPGELRIAVLPQRAKRRQRREAVAQARHVAAFLVDAHEQRARGAPLEVTGELEHGARAADVTGKEHDAPDPAFDQLLDLATGRRAVEAHHDEGGGRSFEIAHRARLVPAERFWYSPRAFVADTEFGLLDPSEIDAVAAIQGWAFGFPILDARAWLERAGLSNVRVARRAARVAGALLEVRMGQWFGGRSVTNLGLAGVAVAPEARGGRVALDLVVESLRAARVTGTAVSTLYPATLTLYRAAGYELAGSRFRWTLASKKLPRDGSDLAVVAIGAGDAGEVEALYRHVASQRNGYLDRGPYVWQRVREPRASDAARGYLVRGASGDLEGYVYLTHRGSEADRQLVVTDFAARTPFALRRLVRLVADHQTTIPTTILHGAAIDPLLFALPEVAWRVELADHWMLRIVDLERALSGRGYPACERTLDLAVTDPHLPENAGSFRLEVAGGVGRVARGGQGSVRLDVRGLAALYTGFLTPDDLARAGMLEADAASLAVLRELFLGPSPAMPDFF